MLTRLQLKELASHTLDGAYFVTLYLNLNPAHVKRDQLQVRFRNLVRSLPPTDRSNVAQDLDKIERFLGDNPSGLKRGMALVSSHRKNFWWEYHSAIPFRDELVIKKEPYLKPLAAQLDLYQRYILVVVGGEDARLFIAGMGEVIEITELYAPEPPAYANRDGGTGDMGGIRARRRKEESRRILNKDIATALDSLMKREEIKRILIGGTDQARGRLKEALPESITKRIVSEFAIDRNAGFKELLDKALPAMIAAEKRFEKIALQELFDKTGIAGGGVFGMANVLQALRQGNVRKLYLIAEQIEPGMVCKSCKAMTPLRDGRCPYCGGELERVSHMFDLAMQTALEQGARVDIIEHAPELKKEGGIAALMRR